MFNDLRSEVRNELGRDKLAAREAKGGEPQSSSVSRRPNNVLLITRSSLVIDDLPGINEIREY